MGNLLAIQPAFPIKFQEFQMELNSVSQRDTGICLVGLLWERIPVRANAEGMRVNCLGIYFLGNPIQIHEIY